MNMNDLRIESVPIKREGMQPTTIWCDIKITHIPTNIVIIIPHEWKHSQNKNLQTAITMLESILN